METFSLQMLNYFCYFHKPRKNIVLQKHFKLRHQAYGFQKFN